MRALLRHVMLHPEEASLRGARARQDMLAHYDVEKVADQVVRRLQHIVRHELPRRRGEEPKGKRVQEQSTRAHAAGERDGERGGEGGGGHAREHSL